MSISDQLKSEEGTVPHAYQDHLGYWTIGCGRLIDQRKGGGLSQDEIDYLLRNDIKRCEGAVREALPWFGALDEPRQAVLIGMAFQMGPKGLLKFHTTLKLIGTGQYEQAAVNMLKSLWARQTPERARRMADQIRTGEWQMKPGQTRARKIRRL